MAIEALMTDKTGKAIKDALASIQAAIQQQGQGGQGGGVSISVETDPEALTTLSQGVVYFLAPGTWTAFSPAVTVPEGKFGIAKYGDEWAVTVLGGVELASAIAAMTSADELTGDEALPMGSGESVTVQQLAEFAEGVVSGNAAHASVETADQAKLASVGKVQELIGEGRRVEPITTWPQTPNTDIIYLALGGDSGNNFDPNDDGTGYDVAAGKSIRLYHDGEAWEQAVEDVQGGGTPTPEAIMSALGEKLDTADGESVEDATIPTTEKVADMISQIPVGKGVVLINGDTEITSWDSSKYYLASAGTYTPATGTTIDVPSGSIYKIYHNGNGWTYEDGLSLPTGSGSVVTVTPAENTGSLVGTITVDDITYQLKAPAGGGGSVTIDTAIPASPSDDHVPSTQLFAEYLVESETALSASAKSNGCLLTTDSYIQNTSMTSTWRVNKYNVENVDVLHIKVDGHPDIKDVNGVTCQFQNTSSLNYNNAGSVVGSPYYGDVDIYVNVPQGATYLLVSSVGNNDANNIKIIAKCNLSAIANGGVKNSIENYNHLVSIEERLEGVEKRDNNRIITGVGPINYSGNLGTSTEWRHSENYIPITPPAKIHWEYGKENSSGGVYLVSYDADKNLISNAGYASSAGVGYRDFTINVHSNVRYIRISFCPYIWRNGAETNTPNYTPIEINGIKYYSDLHPTILDDYGDVWGKFYGEQLQLMREILFKNGNWFSFLHISDSHVHNPSDADLGYANKLLDLDVCKAKFLLHSGDYSTDSYKDMSNGGSMQKLVSTNKPCFLTLGNHDYANNVATSMSDIYATYISPLIDRLGDDENLNHPEDATYYSYIFDSGNGHPNVRFIVLSESDGLTSTDYTTPLSESNPNNTYGGAGWNAWGKMSQAQVDWFVGQLEVAANAGEHVAIAIHTLPGFIDRSTAIVGWDDYYSETMCTDLSFLLEIVDAYINGSTIAESTHNYPHSLSGVGSSVTYSYTPPSSKKGKFIAWFSGHSHYDLIGRIKGYPKQWGIRMCRPIVTAENYNVTNYRGYKPNSMINLYTVNTDMCRLGVYRVGLQDTVYGVERPAIWLSYLDTGIDDNNV